MNYYANNGGVVFVPATATINSGDVVSAGKFIGIAQGPAVSGGYCPVQIEGAGDFTAGGTITFGAEVYYADGVVTTTSGGIPLGAAATAATSGGICTVVLGK